MIKFLKTIFLVDLRAARSRWLRSARVHRLLLAGLLQRAEQRGFAGLNITFPSKQAVLPHLLEGGGNIADNLVNIGRAMQRQSAP